MNNGKRNKEKCSTYIVHLQEGRIVFLLKLQKLMKAQLVVSGQCKENTTWVRGCLLEHNFTLATL